ncbi:hypothetical protein GCM10017784_28340 [Deinococcus indicus]|uniref:hypothetical protein n=1 Tax=Deinococcus indicus TaxID=223556 RepID=UPI001747ED0F|nr:hypothetical protein [Deinococcus indicus]GHG32993.1 hypothetical protein GCM10017784_28340 [Deinococcus indicus]
MFWLWYVPRHLSPDRRAQALAGIPGSHPLEAALAAAATGQLPAALQLCGAPLSGQDENQRVLLRAALLTEAAQVPAARTLLLDHLPLCVHDQWDRAAAALLLAELALAEADLSGALAWCRVADEATTYTAARPLRLPSDLLRARLCAAQGEGAQATARLQQARRRVRNPTDDLQWRDAEAAVSLANGDPVRSVMALATAQAATPCALHRARLQERRQQAQQTPSGPVSRQPARPSRIEVILLSGLHLRVDGEERASPRDALTLLLLAYLILHDGADLAATADLILPPARTGRGSDARRDAARLRGLIARARHLLADPAVILVRGGAVSLDRQHTWTTDLTAALAPPGPTLPAWLTAPWIDDLRGPPGGV